MNNDTQNPVQAISAEQLNEVRAAVIKAFKPLICAEAVIDKNMSIQAVHSEDHWDDNGITDMVMLEVRVVLKSDIEAVEGFLPTYAEGVLNIDFLGCGYDETTDSYSMPSDHIHVGFNYGYYSYNLTWGVKNPDGSMHHDNGEAYGMKSDVDDVLSCDIMGEVFDIEANDANYQSFLRAVFDKARLTTNQM